MKIDILDEGYWSPEVFRGYQAMASMTERCFGSPDKGWRASWAKGEGANQPTKGWCTPHTHSHAIWGGGTPPPGLGGNPPPAWLGGQVSLGFSLGRSNQLGRRPLGETLGCLPISLAPIYIVEGWYGSRTSSLAQPSPSSNTSSSVVLGEALLENHELHQHHAVVLS